MHRAKLGGLLLAGLGLAPGPVAAQQTDTLRLTLDLGFVNTAGNTELTTINAGERVEWKDPELKLAQSFEMVYGRSDGETTSSVWRATARADVVLTEAVAAYGAFGFERNRLAGLARRFDEGAGLAVGLVRTVRNQLDLEGGVSLVQERSVAGTGDDFLSARGAAKYVHQFSTLTYFRQTMEATTNLEATEDFRINSESAVVAPLSRSLALKVSYVVRFDNVPEPGFRTTDRVLTTALQLTL